MGPADEAGRVVWSNNGRMLGALSKVQGAGVLSVVTLTLLG